MNGSRLNVGKVGKLALWGLGLVALANAGAGGVGTDVGPSLADVQRLAKIGYREIRLDDRVHDIDYAEDNVVYTTHYIVYQTGGKITSLDFNNMKTMTREPNLSRFIGIGGRLFGHTDTKLGIIDLEKNSSKTIVLLDGGEFNSGNNLKNSNISLYPMLNNRLYYHLGLSVEKLGECSVYGILKLDTYDSLWEKNSCIDYKFLNSQIETFRGEGYANGIENYLFVIPGSDPNDMLIYSADDGKLMRESRVYRNLVDRFAKILSSNDKTLNRRSSNYFVDSVCKNADGKKYGPLKEYVQQKSGKKVYIVSAHKCADSTFTVLWSPTPDKNEQGRVIFSSYKNDYRLSIIGGK
jgi:hypothetical protein